MTNLTRIWSLSSKWVKRDDLMKFLKVCLGPRLASSISYFSWASWAGPFLKNGELSWAELDLIWKFLSWAELFSSAQLAQKAQLAQLTKFTTLAWRNSVWFGSRVLTFSNAAATSSLIFFWMMFLAALRPKTIDSANGSVEKWEWSTKMKQLNTIYGEKW